jgi:hypothetical protein
MNMYAPQSSQINRAGDNYVYGGALDPSQIAQFGPRGSFWIQVAKKNSGPIGLFIKQDRSITTNWTKLVTSIIINGTPVDNGVLDLNFIGDGVVVDDKGGGAFDIIIEGTEVQKEGVQVEDPTTTFNFKGVGVLVTNPVDGTVDIEIPGLVGGGSPFNEKFFRWTPRDFRADGNASGTSFKSFSVLDLSSGGVSDALITIPIINYQLGDDITVNLHFIVDNTAGGQRGVFTQLSGAIFEVGDDVDTLVPVVKTDQYDVVSQEGLTYLRPFTFTAAELGDPADGDYFLQVIFERDATDPQDRYNRDLHLYAARAFWEQ